MIPQRHPMPEAPLTPLRRRHSSDDVSLFLPYELEDVPQSRSPAGSIANDFFADRGMRHNSHANSPSRIISSDIVSSHRKRAVSQQRLPPAWINDSPSSTSSPQRPQPKRLGPERFDFLKRNTSESPSRKSPTPGSLKEESKQPYRGPNYVDAWRASPSRSRTWVDLPRRDSSPDFNKRGRQDSARDVSQGNNAGLKRGPQRDRATTEVVTSSSRPKSPVSSGDESDAMEPDDDDPWSPFHADKGDDSESFSHTIQHHHVPRRRLLSLPSNLQFPTDLRFTLSEFISKGITAPSMYMFPINPKSPPRK